MFHLQTNTYIDELDEIFQKLSMKTVQVHLIIWTTLTLFDIGGGGGGGDGPSKMFLTTVPKRFGGGS